MRWPIRQPIWAKVYHLSSGRLDRRPRYTDGQLPALASGWQDTDSGRFFGWRCRRAHVDGMAAFAVEYVICSHCRIGWVDKPHTIERYRRSGLAAAALRALRTEHLAVVWHTGSGHSSSSKRFWAVVGDGVAGGYLPRGLCAHVVRDGGLLPDWQLRRQGLL